MGNNNSAALAMRGGDDNSSSSDDHQHQHLSPPHNTSNHIASSPALAMYGYGDDQTLSPDSKTGGITSIAGDDDDSLVSSTLNADIPDQLVHPSNMSNTSTYNIASAERVADTSDTINTSATLVDHTSICIMGKENRPNSLSDDDLFTKANQLSNNAFTPLAEFVSLALSTQTITKSPEQFKMLEYGLRTAYFPSNEMQTSRRRTYKDCCEELSLPCWSNLKKRYYLVLTDSADPTSAGTVYYNRRNKPCSTDKPFVDVVELYRRALRLYVDAMERDANFRVTMLPQLVRDNYHTSPKCAELLLANKKVKAATSVALDSRSLVPSGSTDPLSSVAFSPSLPHPRPQMYGPYDETSFLKGALLATERERQATNAREEADREENRRREQADREDQKRREEQFERMFNKAINRPAPTPAPAPAGESYILNRLDEIQSTVQSIKRSQTDNFGNLNTSVRSVMKTVTSVEKAMTPGHRYSSTPQSAYEAGSVPSDRSSSVDPCNLFGHGEEPEESEGLMVDKKFVTSACNDLVANMKSGRINDSEQIEDIQHLQREIETGIFKPEEVETIICKSEGKLATLFDVMLGQGSEVQPPGNKLICFDCKALNTFNFVFIIENDKDMSFKQLDDQDSVLYGMLPALGFPFTQNFEIHFNGGEHVSFELVSAGSLLSMKAVSIVLQSVKSIADMSFLSIASHKSETYGTLPLHLPTSNQSVVLKSSPPFADILARSEVTVNLHKVQVDEELAKMLNKSKCIISFERCEFEKYAWSHLFRHGSDKQLRIKCARAQEREFLPSQEEIIRAMKDRNIKSIVFECGSPVPEEGTRDEQKAKAIDLIQTAKAYDVYIEVGGERGTDISVWDDAQIECGADPELILKARNKEDQAEETNKYTNAPSEDDDVPPAPSPVGPLAGATPSAETTNAANLPPSASNFDGFFKNVASYKASGTYWKCDVCAVKNDNDRGDCEACGVARTGLDTKTPPASDDGDRKMPATSKDDDKKMPARFITTKTPASSHGRVNDINTTGLASSTTSDWCMIPSGQVASFDVTFGSSQSQSRNAASARTSTAGFTFDTTEASSNTEEVGFRSDSGWSFSETATPITTSAPPAVDGFTFGATSKADVSTEVATPREVGLTVGGNGTPAAAATEAFGSGEALANATVAAEAPAANTNSDFVYGMCDFLTPTGAIKRNNNPCDNCPNKIGNLCGIHENMVKRALVKKCKTGNCQSTSSSSKATLCDVCASIFDDFMATR